MPCVIACFSDWNVVRDLVDDNWNNIACHNIDNIYHYDNGIYGDFSEEAENRCVTAWLDTKSESCKRETKLFLLVMCSYFYLCHAHEVYVI